MLRNGARCRRAQIFLDAIQHFSSVVSQSIFSCFFVCVLFVLLVLLSILLLDNIFAVGCADTCFFLWLSGRVF